jgi:DNA-binding MarR family transcriptional regulator
MSSAFTQKNAGAEIGPPLIGALLRIPTVVRAHMLAALHAHGFSDVTTAHFQVLRWPGPQGRRPVELAEQAGMSRQAMNYLLGQLEELGYLERRIDPGDVRSRSVHLTERGLSTISVIRDAVAEVEGDWEAQMGAEDWQQLKRLLVRLNGAVGERQTGPTATQPSARLSPPPARRGLGCPHVQASTPDHRR